MSSREMTAEEYFEFVKSELCCANQDAIRGPGAVSWKPYEDAFGVDPQHLFDKNMVRRIMEAQLVAIVSRARAEQASLP
jgi:hypothetical protein